MDHGSWVTVADLETRERRWLVLGWLVALVLVVAAVVWTWRASTPWSTFSWGSVLLVPAWIVLVWVAIETEGRLRRWAFGAVAVMTVGAIFFVVYAPAMIANAKFGSAEASLAEIAESMLAEAPPTTWGCGPLPDPGVEVDDLGPPDDACLLVGPESGGDGRVIRPYQVRAVRFRWGDRSLVYDQTGHALTSMSPTCYRTLDDHWTAAAPLEGADCPEGMAFTGAG